MMLFLALIESKHQFIKSQNTLKNSYAGPLFMKEILSVNRWIIKNKKSPVTCIIGGSKGFNKNWCNFIIN